MRNAIFALLTSVTCAANAAQDTVPSFDFPDTSEPVVAAFVEWHTALVSGNFAAFRDFTPLVPGVTDASLRQLFEQMRLNSPKTLKITAPKLTERGSYEFSTIGCAGAQVVISSVAVRQEGNSWRVAGSGWGQSWNPKIAGSVKCP